MRMFKCPQCDGKSEYNLIQSFKTEQYNTPVKCNCENGKITWSHYCMINRKRKKV